MEAREDGFILAHDFKDYSILLEAPPQPHSFLSKSCHPQKKKSPGSSHEAQGHAYRVFKPQSLDLPCDFSSLHHLTSGALERSP